VIARFSKGDEMTGRLDGKVAIITGSTQGVGEGIAHKFAREGATVIINGRSEDKGNRVLTSIKAISAAPARFIRADVRHRAELQAMVDEVIDAFGRVDIVANNAQILLPWKRAEDPDVAEALAIEMPSSVYASLWLSQIVFPHMKRQGGGRIINFGSTSGVLGNSFAASYNIQKEGLRGLTRTMAQEWGRHGITVNTLMPAAASPGHERLVASRAAFAAAEEFRDQIRKWDLTDALQPFVVKDAENGVGEAAVGLASDSGRFITGQTIFADGGIHLWGLNKHMSIPGQAYQASVERA
jgi:NAD(P)-dependent dehydrogenase (short-subunit alcohol dehydrogenase family)